MLLVLSLVPLVVVVVVVLVVLVLVLLLLLAEQARVLKSWRISLKRQNERLSESCYEAATAKFWPSAKPRRDENPVLVVQVYPEQPRECSVYTSTWCRLYHRLPVAFCPIPLGGKPCRIIRIVTSSLCFCYSKSS